jgi:hypothetical protein
MNALRKALPQIAVHFDLTTYGERNERVDHAGDDPLLHEGEHNVGADKDLEKAAKKKPGRKGRQTLFVI